MKWFRRKIRGRRECKIKAHPASCRYVLVCTSFFLEARKIGGGWQEAGWRPATRHALENRPGIWRRIAGRANIARLIAMPTLMILHHLDGLS
jgi:hypothetical protein